MRRRRREEGGGRSAGLAWQLSRQPERQKGEQANKSYLSGPLFSFFIHFILALGRARALARSLGKVINAACKLEGLAAAAAGLTVPYCTVLHFLSFCVGKSDWAKLFLSFFSKPFVSQSIYRNFVQLNFFFNTSPFEH